LAFGRGALARLVSARVTRSFPRLLGDLARLEAAGALLRLARELVPERVPDVAVYEALSQLLAALDEPDVPAKPLLVAGQTQLLALTGFAPQLSSVRLAASCRRRPTRAVRCDARRSHVPACGGGPDRISSAVRTRLAAVLNGGVDAVIQAAQAGWNAGELREAQHLLALFVAAGAAGSRRGARVIAARQAEAV